MATFPAPDPIQSTFLIPGSNTPGNGVQVFFYTNLTSTKTTVYKDSGTSTAWTNPIVLDSGGNLPSGGQVYINSGETLTVKYAPANDSDPPVSVYRTLNDVQGINDVSITIASTEWTAGTTPTFISATSFAVAGNQTAIYTVGRRVKTTNTGGTIYSTIVSSVFGAVTTVTVVNDSGVLDSGLSAVEYALLSSNNASIPGVRIINGTYTFQGSSTVFQSPSVVFQGSSTVFLGLVDISASTAGQIKFPSTSNASADLNTLDDYEEGAWTPELQFAGVTTGITYVTSAAAYTKIGNRVFFEYVLSLSSKGAAAGVASVRGLPFSVAGIVVPESPMYWSRMSSTQVHVLGLIGSAQPTEIALFGASSATVTPAQLLDTAFSNSTQVLGCGCYRT